MNSFGSFSKAISQKTQSFRNVKEDIFRSVEIKVKIAKLESEINDIYMNIGELIYLHYNKDVGNMNAMEIANECNRIREKKEELKILKCKINNYNKIYCRYCGERILEGEEICPNCGNRVKYK